MVIVGGNWNGEKSRHYFQLTDENMQIQELKLPMVLINACVSCKFIKEILQNDDAKMNAHSHSRPHSQKHHNGSSGSSRHHNGSHHSSHNGHTSKNGHHSHQNGHHGYQNGHHSSRNHK